MKLYGKFGLMALALVVALVLPMAAFAQTPVAPTELLTDVGDAAATVIDPIQVTYFIITAVLISTGIWLVRRSLKLGR